MTKAFSGLKSRYDFLALASLALGVLLFYAKILLSGNTLFGSDFVLQFHPWKKFLFEYFWANGSIPFWNPYTFSGVPFVANIQASMFYPLGFLYYLLPPDTAYLYSTVLHCILGSWFMYLFMRDLGVSPIGSALSAIIFTYNGYFMAHVYAGHLSFVQNYIWLPLVLMFQRRSLYESRFLKWTAAAGLVLGIQILGGFPQIAFYTILILCAHAFYRAVSQAFEGRKHDSLKAAGGVLMIVVLGFSVAAIQVFPTAELTRFSMRSGGLPYEYATHDSLHPRDILSFFIPELFGNAANGTYWGNADEWHFWETCGYVGILPLVLLLSAAGGKTNGPSRSFFTWIAFLSLLTALGRFNPFYPVLYRWCGFGYFRIPAQILFLSVFSVAVISGIKMDVDAWPRARWRSVRWSAIAILGLSYISVPVLLHWKGGLFLSSISRWFGLPLTIGNIKQVYVSTVVSSEKTGILFLLTLALFSFRRLNRIGPALFSALCCGIVIADLFAFGQTFVKPDSFDEAREKEELVSKLSRSPVDGRVLTERPLFYENDGLECGFPSILGYDPMSLKRYTHFIQASQDEPLSNETVFVAEIKNPESRLLAQLNLKEVISTDGQMKRLSGIPYLSMVEKTVIRNPGRILDFMKSPDFLPGKMVVLEPEYRGTLPAPLPDGQFKSDWEIVGYRNEEITIKVSANNECFLILSEIFYPGWAATVDGAPTLISRANYIFRAIALERGSHLVCMKFVSWPFRIGAAISIGALALILFVMVRKS